jgi:hypothetical protein
VGARIVDFRIERRKKRVSGGTIYEPNVRTNETPDQNEPIVSFE